MIAAAALVGGCSVSGAPASTSSALPDQPAPPIPTAAPTRAIPIPTAAPPPAPSATPLPDYGPLAAELEALRQAHDFNLGIGFVDIQTGQTVSVNGMGRFYALSTFKGPLAAYYLWLLERGQIVETPGDRERITAMLAVSSNPDTTCIIKRVGGLAGFNDWLADQGMTRANNFVYGWDSWVCYEDNSAYMAKPDERYRLGDAALGLPGDGALLACPDVPCNKAFAPLELAALYARLYHGEVLNSADTLTWLGWMEKTPEEAALLAGLPPDAAARGYIKDGYAREGEFFPVNFFHEAGVLETSRGAFALAVFMQGNPDWTGEEILAETAGIVYQHFQAAHPVPGE
ncbi:MAG: hypothetical protein Kow00124_14300 [Anaerolineae bacterium]